MPIQRSYMDDPQYRYWIAQALASGQRQSGGSPLAAALNAFSQGFSAYQAKKAQQKVEARNEKNAEDLMRAATATEDPNAKIREVNPEIYTRSSVTPEDIDAIVQSPPPGDPAGDAARAERAQRGAEYQRLLAQELAKPSTREATWLEAVRDTKNTDIIEALVPGMIKSKMDEEADARKRKLDREDDINKVRVLNPGDEMFQGTQRIGGVPAAIPAPTIAGSRYYNRQNNSWEQIPGYVEDQQQIARARAAANAANRQPQQPPGLVTVLMPDGTPRSFRENSPELDRAIEQGAYEIGAGFTNNYAAPPAGYGSGLGTVGPQGAGTYIPPGVDYRSATGAVGMLQNFANRGLDAVGLAPYFNDNLQATEALNSLDIQTRTALQDALPGRPSNYLMQELDKMAVKPNSPLRGPAGAAARLQMTRDFINNAADTIEHEVIGNPRGFTRAQLGQARNKLSELRRLAQQYDAIIQNGQGGTQPTDELPVVNTPEEARKLPPGTRFLTPDGREKVR